MPASPPAHVRQRRCSTEPSEVRGERDEPSVMSGFSQVRACAKAAPRRELVEGPGTFCVKIPAGQRGAVVTRVTYAGDCGRWRQEFALGTTTWEIDGKASGRASTSRQQMCSSAERIRPVVPSGRGGGCDARGNSCEEDCCPCRCCFWWACCCSACRWRLGARLTALPAALPPVSRSVLDCRQIEKMSPFPRQLRWFTVAVFAVRGRCRVVLGAPGRTAVCRRPRGARSPGAAVGANARQIARRRSPFSGARGRYGGDRRLPRRALAPRSDARMFSRGRAPRAISPRRRGVGCPSTPVSRRSHSSPRRWSTESFRPRLPDPPCSSCSWQFRPRLHT